MNKFYSRESCGICNGKNLLPVIDLGEMPVSNNFLPDQKSFEKEGKFPLTVSLCDNCKSFQLSHIVSPEFIFNNYSYATGASAPLVNHFHNLADEIADRHIDSPNDLVVEVGSNDGSLLLRIKDRAKILGVDPAPNIAKEAVKNGVPTEIGFFGQKLSKDLRSKFGLAKVVVANNVMAHIDDIQDAFKGVRSLLAPSGKFIFEVHWVGNLLNEGGFDQIYHEHFYYHSLHSLKVLLESVGMTISDVRSVPIHGESIRVYATLSGQSSDNVRKFLSREKDLKLHQNQTYFDFSDRVERNRRELKDLLTKLKSESKRIFGYGAPSKGNTLINYLGIGPETIEFIIDTTPAKQGKYTPGSHIKVVSGDILEKETPDYALLLSWNYANAIMEKEKVLRKRGVKFIIPVPKVKIV